MSEPKTETRVVIEMTVTQYNNMVFAVGFAAGATFNREERDLADKFYKLSTELCDQARSKKVEVS